MAKRFKDNNPAAISMHCLAPCTNLCLQEVTRSHKCIKEALNFSMEAVQLIKLSPKCQVMFESIQKMEEPLEVTMEEVSHGTDDCSRRASSVLP